MDFKIYQHRLNRLSARFNLMVALVLGLLLSNGIMSVLLYHTVLHQRIEITPFFEGTSYTKSNRTVDSHYLQMMSENFIYSRLNVTPETVRSHHQRLLSYIDAREYVKFTRKLNQEAALIIRQKIASHFVITKITTDSNQFRCVVSGILKRSVGLRELPDSPLQYVLQFRYQDGRLTVVQFRKEILNENH